MKTQIPYLERQYAPNTIGARIQELIKQLGQHPTGIYILEQALIHACFPHGTSSGYVPMALISDNGSNLLVHDTPGYQSAQAVEDALLARVKQNLERQEVPA